MQGKLKEFLIYTPKKVLVLQVDPLIVIAAMIIFTMEYGAFANRSMTI